MKKFEDSRKTTKNENTLKLFELFVPNNSKKNNFFVNTEPSIENQKKDFLKFFKLLNKKGSNIEIIGFYKNYKLFKKGKILFTLIENHILDKKNILSVKESKNLQIKFGKIKNLIDVNGYYNYDYDNNKRLFYENFITLENTEYLVISNPKILKLLNKFIKKKNEYLVKFFLRSFGLQKRKSTIKIINRLLPLYKKIKLSKNETIIKQEEKGSKIYIIKKGTFIINLKISEKDKKLFENLNFNNFQIQKVMNKDIKINVCKKYELLGEEVFFKNNYCFNIKSLTSNSEVYKFDKSIVKIFTQNMKNIIYNIIKNKIKLRKNNLKKNVGVILANESFKGKEVKINFKYLSLKKKENLDVRIIEKISRLSLKKCKSKINPIKFKKLNKTKTKEFFFTQRKFPFFKSEYSLQNNILNSFTKKQKSNSPQKITKSFSKLLNKSSYLIKSFKTKKNNFIIKNFKIAN